VGGHPAASDKSSPDDEKHGATGIQGCVDDWEDGIVGHVGCGKEIIF
jgi:hypothetical protein